MILLYDIKMYQSKYFKTFALYIVGNINLPNGENFLNSTYE